MRLLSPTLYMSAVLMATALSLPVSLFAQQVDSGSRDARDIVGSFQPNILPSLTVPEASGAIEVDGMLDEAAWATAARAVNFSEVFPGDQSQPPVKITGLITYTNDALYVGIIVRDDPKTIRANLTERDAIWQDDYAGILLDPNRDGQALYFIAANPLGIQADTRISANNEDEGFDLLFYSGGKITDTGYQIELAIPFKSLRFPNQDVQAWGTTFWITHPRESRSQYSWAAISRDNPCWSCQLGTIEGLRGVRAGRNLEILPALTGAGAGALENVDIPRSGFVNERMQVEPSLNLKYGITSELTADVTVNPDFSQIESDEAQIDVNSTFALFFPERRPFFQEGAGLFDTEIQTVYTRSINDPITAAKVTGRFGQTDVAFIGARDNTSPLMLPFEESSELIESGKSVSNILRIKHNFGNDAFVGALLTDRRLDQGGSGSTVSLDGSVRFWQKYRFSGQFAASHSQEPVDATLSERLGTETFAEGRYTSALDGESFWGHGMTFELDREARYYGFEAGYELLSPTFRADNGFVRQNNNQRVYFWQGVTLYPSKHLSFVDRLRPNIVVGSRWNTYGLQKSLFVSGGVFMQLKRQTQVNIRYERVREQFKETWFEGLSEFSVFANSNFSEPVQLGFSLEVGRDIARFLSTPELGNSFDLSAFGRFSPGQHLTISPQVAYSRLVDRESQEAYFSGYILRSRVKYQFSRRLYLRTIVQYNDFSKSLEIDPLVTYKINAFTAVHAGSTHDFDQFTHEDDLSKFFRQRSRQVFFKFQYLFRV